MTSNTRLIGAFSAGLIVLGAIVTHLCTRGPAYGEIACRVTQAGAPLDHVEIIFIPDGNGPRSSGVSDGSGFCVARTDALVGSKERAGAPVGTYKVLMIDRREALREQHARLEWEAVQGVMNPMSKKAVTESNNKKTSIRVPKEYNQCSDTPLAGIEVKPGKNEFEFEVKLMGKPGLAAAKN